MSFGVAFGFLSGTTVAGRALRPVPFRHRRRGAVRRRVRRHGPPDFPHPPDEGGAARLESRLEEAADRNWEISEAQERAKSFFEAQGDVIVRRDGDGTITYANDAFCALAGRAREELLATTFALPVREQGDIASLADGTRVHDQKIAARRRALDRLARGLGARRRRQRSAERRPRRDRPRDGRARARRGARSGGSGEPRQVALPRHGLARDPHAAQRHPRHGRPARRHAAVARADDLPEGGEDVGRHAAVVDRGDARSLQDRSRPARSRRRGRSRSRPSSKRRSNCSGRAPRPRASRSAAMSTSACRRAWSAMRRGCARCCSISPATPSSSPKRGGVSIIVEPDAQPDAIAISVRDTGIGISAARPGAHLPRIRAGRRRLDAQIRRHRPRPHHFQAHRRAHGRAHRGRKRARRRLDLPRHACRCRASATATSRRSPSPDLAGNDILIVAPAAIEASLLARRLQRWGARTSIVPDEKVAAAHVAGAGLERRAGRPRARHRGERSARPRWLPAIPRRIVLVTPAMRTELAGLKDAGFTGYLIKPVRAASLAARFARRRCLRSGRREPRRTDAPRQARSGRGPFDPGRRGQRDQRAAGARAAGQARPPPDHGGERRRGDRVLACRARGRRAVTTAC